LGKLFTRASVTNQYNLVPADGWWQSLAEKVTSDLAETNGSLPLSGWLSHLQATACTQGSAPGPTLGNEYGRTFVLPDYRLYDTLNTAHVEQF